MGSISQAPDIDKEESLTRIAARRLRCISKGEFSSEVRAKTSLCLLDFLGAAQSGLLNPLSRGIPESFKLHAGNAEACVFGRETPVSAETAAFTNATLAHRPKRLIRDVNAPRDDMHLASCAHLGGMVVSAVLALSQREHWSSEQILRGIIGGYETDALLGTAIRSKRPFNKHLRPSGLIGAFAATAAAASGAYTDKQTSMAALSLALNMACGLNEWANTGGQEIFIHNGTASRAGINSYDLARRGVQASGTVLEGKDGLFAAVNAGAGAAENFRHCFSASQIGQGFLDVRFKPAPTCDFTQTTSAIALRLRRQHKFDVSAIERILITTTSAALSLSRV